MEKDIAKFSNCYSAREKTDDFSFSSSKNAITLKEKKVTLSNKLANLFHILYFHQNTLVTRESIINSLWKSKDKNNESKLTHHICMLRKVLVENFKDHIQIETVPKLGYILRIKSILKTSEYNELKRLKSLGWQVNLPAQKNSSQN